MPQPFAALRQRLATGQPVTLCTLGDSISEVGRTPGWQGGATAPEQQYAARFRDLLAAAWPASPITLHHHGVGGQNTAEGLARLPDVLARQPHLAIVAFGANDQAYHPLTPAATAAALRAILTQLTAVGVAPMAVSASMANPALPAWQRGPAYVDAQQTVCAELGLPFANLYRELTWRSIAGEPWEHYHHGPDNCHPNDEGHALWAEQLLATLRAALAAS